MNDEFSRWMREQNFGQNMSGVMLAEMAWEVAELKTQAKFLSKDENEAKRKLLEYLIGVAQESGGSGVWRALFAEMLNSLENA